MCPAAPAAWYGLARLYLLEGKFDEAKKWAKKLVDSGQADESARQMLKAAEEKKLDDNLRRMIEPMAFKEAATKTDGAKAVALLEEFDKAALSDDDIHAQLAKANAKAGE